MPGDEGHEGWQEKVRGRKDDLRSDFARFSGESRFPARDDKNAPASIVQGAMWPALAAVPVARVEMSSVASYYVGSKAR